MWTDMDSGSAHENDKVLRSPFVCRPKLFFLNLSKAQLLLEVVRWELGKLNFLSLASLMLVRSNFHAGNRQSKKKARQRSRVNPEERRRHESVHNSSGSTPFRAQLVWTINSSLSFVDKSPRLRSTNELLIQLPNRAGLCSQRRCPSCRINSIDLSEFWKRSA
jgi:hypothetical protein